MPLARSSPAELVWSLQRATEIPGMQSRARTFLADHGFSLADTWAVAIALAEAATNALKFAGHAEVTLAFVSTPRPHACLDVVDDGPGFDDPSTAHRDRVSEGVDLDATPHPLERRGLGLGLGSISRMMDELVLGNRPEGGAHLTARRYRR